MHIPGWQCRIFPEEAPSVGWEKEQTEGLSPDMCVLGSFATSQHEELRNALVHAISSKLSNRAVLGSEDYKLVGLVVCFPLKVCCRSLHQDTHTLGPTKRALVLRLRSMIFTFLNSCYCSSVSHPLSVTSNRFLVPPPSPLPLEKLFVSKETNSSESIGRK